MTHPSRLEAIRSRTELDPDTGCWVWTGPLDRAGYPYSYMHRQAWEAANGPRPAGHHIHHRCENTACVNPEHLETISDREHYRLHKLEGEAGLDFEDVREVIRLGTVPGVRARDVAYAYGIGETRVYKWWSNTYGPWQDEIPRSERPLPVRKCARPKCGQEFQQRNRHAKYCSKHCQERAWTERNRERLNREAREARARRKAA